MPSTSPHHPALLEQIIKKSGKPTQHTFSDSYLGNGHPRYPISTPNLRAVGKAWIKANPLTPKEFRGLIASLVKAPSSTEKTLAGILMDYVKEEHLDFEPKNYDQWLNHVEGWAEVDALCYGHISFNIILGNWSQWKKLLLSLNNSKNINKRRASLVLLCKPLTQTNDERLQSLAFQLIDSLQSEKEILITKAVSWILRSMVKLHRQELKIYIAKNRSTLPAIAVRETLTKIKTGRKNPKK